MSHQSNFRNRANLQPNTTAQILAAVLPPLLRSSEPEKEKRAAGQPIAIRFVDNRDQP
jgi:hypothetical protein